MKWHQCIYTGAIREFAELPMDGGWYLVVMVGSDNGEIVHVETNKKTYNRRDLLVVTHPTTNLPACGLNAARRRVGTAWVS
ncbi:hypothetical protein BO99DRAFT_254129 [Aspergillus violaceofuscus CBS 115571]|uniref:Uncharacterized protein n=1 Tax=Aspergillus violaceofuscus (strain CBS 115571) TaxID=1450538 RepID=A0A2V5H0Q8_ASPV1|nr:hypothetical protein BO99DRAFT_254129 [Aspergillus violaceofuscus CBS 115571]